MEKEGATLLTKSIEKINERVHEACNGVPLNARMTHVERVIGFSAIGAGSPAVNRRWRPLKR